MNTRIIALALGLVCSPWVLAAGDGNHDHSQHKSMDQPKMDHSQRKGMDHSQHDRFADFKKTIPISDGSSEDDIPMPYPGTMHMEDDPTLSKMMIHKFETQAADGENPLVLEAEAWIGKDLNKLWFKTEVEKTGSEVEHAELQVLYSKAISSYWDLQTGLRKDFQPEGREWLALGVKGLAPYYIDIDAALFAGDDGRTAARLKAEKEIMLTQKTALLPELELNLYSKDDPAMGIGSGLSDAKVGLRLLHEVRREFAPYIGVEWSKKFEGTAEYARDHGESTEDTRAVVGIHGGF